MEEDNEDVIYLNNKKVKLTHLQINNNNYNKPNLNTNKREYTTESSKGENMEKSSSIQINVLDCQQNGRNTFSERYKQSLASFTDSLDK